MFSTTRQKRPRETHPKKFEAALQLTIGLCQGGKSAAHFIGKRHGGTVAHTTETKDLHVFT
jgi:hypothetical protein